MNLRLDGGSVAAPDASLLFPTSPLPAAEFDALVSRLGDGGTGGGSSIEASFARPTHRRRRRWTFGDYHDMLDMSFDIDELWGPDADASGGLEGSLSSSTAADAEVDTAAAAAAAGLDDHDDATNSGGASGEAHRADGDGDDDDVAAGLL